MYKKHLEKVEKVLEEFPAKYSKNYYTNKKTLKIVKSDTLSISFGEYDHKKNKITLYNEDSLAHELFHMAFRDKKKLRKKLFRGSELIISNGIAYQNIKTKEIGGVGLTEGFTEYLTRKSFSEDETYLKGHSFLYFFTDLLISIYGEDIIKYPLQNDTIGFVSDERFFEIVKFSSNMDNLYDYLKYMKYLNKNSKSLYKKIESCTKEENLKIHKLLNSIKDGLRESIINLFNEIINEYNNADESKISKEEFIMKLKEFIISSDYNFILSLSSESKMLLEEVQTIIDNFENTKILIKQNNN